jgi:hypothetical protein
MNENGSKTVFNDENDNRHIEDIEINSPVSPYSPPVLFCTDSDRSVLLNSQKSLKVDNGKNYFDSDGKFHLDLRNISGLSNGVTNGLSEGSSLGNGLTDGLSLNISGLSNWVSNGLSKGSSGLTNGLSLNKGLDDGLANVVSTQYVPSSSSRKIERDKDIEYDKDNSLQRNRNVSFASVVTVKVIVLLYMLYFS